MNERAVRYLLGRLPDEERERIEQTYFADGGEFEAMLAAEDELFLDYVSGELTAEDRSAFEQRFLATAEGRRKLAFAEALIEGLRQAESSRARAAIEPQKPDWRRSPILQWSFAAAAALLAAVAWSLQRDLNRSRDQTQALQARLTQERAAVAAARTAAPPARTPIVVATTLIGGVTRAPGEVRRLSVPPGADTLRVTLQLGREPAGEKPVVALRNVDGNELWSAGAAPAAGASELVADIPARLLQTADYEIVVTRSAGLRPLTYTLSIVRAP